MRTAPQQRHDGASHAKARGGFTLTEIMVSIAIIIILMAVGAAGVLTVQGIAAESQTLATMAALKAIADEYKRQADDPVNHGMSPGGEYVLVHDWTQSKKKNATKITVPLDAIVNGSIERFVWAVAQEPVTKKMILALGGGVFVDDSVGLRNKFGDRDGFNEVVDGWGRQLRYFTTNVDPDNGATLDSTVPPHRSPFFVSAGPDGEFGNVSASTSSLQYEQSEDNLYSPGVKAP